MGLLFEAFFSCQSCIVLWTRSASSRTLQVFFVWFCFELECILKSGTERCEGGVERVPFSLGWLNSSLSTLQLLPSDEAAHWDKSVSFNRCTWPLIQLDILGQTTLPLPNCSSQLGMLIINLTFIYVFPMMLLSGQKYSPNEFTLNHSSIVFQSFFFHLFIID